MKIEYDTAHDLLNIEFLDDVPIDDSLEVDGIVIDYAKDKRIVAIEVLDASKRTTRSLWTLSTWLSSNHPDPMPFMKTTWRIAGRKKTELNVLGRSAVNRRRNQELRAESSKPLEPLAAAGHSGTVPGVTKIKHGAWLTALVSS